MTSNGDGCFSEREVSFSPALEHAIDNIVNKEQYITCDVTKKKVSSEGANFLGELFEVEIHGKTADGDKTLSLFVKKSLCGGNINDCFTIEDAYARETFFYKELSAVYNELQDEADVPKEERYKIITSYDVPTLEAVILDNMAVKGYKTPHRMNVITIKYAELCIEQLAKFHGLSLVLKYKRPQYFDEKIRPLKSTLVWSETWHSIVENFTNISKSTVDGKLRKLIEDYLPTLLEKYPQYACVDDVSDTVGCVVHADYRPSNILMRTMAGETVDVIPVDYQLMHYGCPVHDIMFFIYLGTDRQFRSEHLVNLKNLYYDTLNKFLQYFGLDVEELYPRKEFERIFSERQEYGLMLSIFGYSIIFAPETDPPDFCKDQMTTVQFKPNYRLEHRLRGLLEEFIDMGYFNK